MTPFAVRRSRTLPVLALLGRLERLSLELAPRYLGIEAEGRETFGYVEGEVPDELDSTFDATPAAAALLIRRFHDATTGSPLTQGRETFCRTISPRATPSSATASRSR